MHYATRLIAGGIFAVALAATWAAPADSTEIPRAQVLFVCEHGNVKSLMAASYFNQLAHERVLPFEGISRGTAPDSTTVPPAIEKALRHDGFDVTSFHPAAVTAADVSASQHVITIGTTLPQAAQVDGVTPEQWNDVPPASVDYDASRAVLQAHIEILVEQLAVPGSQ